MRFLTQLLAACVPMSVPPSTAASSGPAVAPSVRFLPPVIVHGAWNTSRGWRLDGNESMMDSFYALDDNFLFGSYMEHWNLESGEGVFVASNDSGRSWHLSQILKPQPAEHVSPACQERLDAFCNNESTVGPDCLDPQTKAFHRKMGPMYALFDKGLNFGTAWRCYSHESLAPDMKRWSATSKTPSAFCSRPGPALARLATSCDGAADRNWAGGEQALTGHGLRAPGTLRTLGLLHAGSDGNDNKTSFSSAGAYQYSISGDQTLAIHPTPRGTSFTGLPKPMLSLAPSEPGKPFQCFGPSRAFFEPVSSVALPDGSFLAANVLCFDDSPSVVSNPNISAKSLVAWRSTDGFDWTFQGIITDARDYVPHKSTAGNTEENDMAMAADGKTVMVVMRTDGDCNCAGATGHNECGLYRPYYQSYSSDYGKTWSIATPIPGTGCARPRLLSLGVGKPMLMSGGRMCWANMTGLFLWVNPSGMPNAEWTRYSLSYAHNQGALRRVASALVAPLTLCPLRLGDVAQAGRATSHTCLMSASTQPTSSRRRRTRR